MFCVYANPLEHLVRIEFTSRTKSPHSQPRISNWKISATNDENKESQTARETQKDNLPGKEGTKGNRGQVTVGEGDRETFSKSGLN